MALASAVYASEVKTYRREIGEVVGPNEGPWFVVIAGIHGNERAGVQAAERVLDTLESRRLFFRGKFIALSGNVTALNTGRRYLDSDLNRMWTAQRLRMLANGQATPAAANQQIEEQEQAELYQVLNRIFKQAKAPLFFLDLHTTSSNSSPFAIFGDTLANRRFARQFPLPLVLGLEEVLSGVLIDYLTNCGHVAMAVEGGQHEAPEAVDNLESAIWIGLAASGNIRASDFPELEHHRKKLKRSAQGLPAILDVHYRHEIDGNTQFQMKPGFKNFQRIRKGQLLAQDRHGVIRAPMSGHILMPLYQGLGNDGFFIARPVKPIWLTVSAVLRRLKVDRIVHWLPGIRRHPQQKHLLILNEKIARFYPMAVMHLLGFRNRRRQANLLVVSRRERTNY